MIRPNCLTGMLAAAAICLTVAGSLHAQAMNFTIDGVQRQALILAPANASRSSERLPLLFAFHGHGGNMIQTAAQMRFDKVWPESIVVTCRDFRRQQTETLVVMSRDGSGNPENMATAI